MKHLVLDTNVLLHDPKCLENFGDNYVYIPLACIEELDHHKSRQDDVGRNAREVARQLDAYREIGTLSEGVDTSKGGKIFITPKSAQTKKSVHIPAELDLNKVDNQIIEFALSLSQKEGVEDVKVISKDINVRLKCDSLKICSEDYYALRAKSNTDEVYGGVVRLAHDDIQEIYDNSELDVFKSSENFSVAPNTFVVVKNYTTNQSVIVRVLNPELGSYKIIKSADSPMGIKHKNKEQMMALDLLMDPSVHLVTLVGLAGSGKTLLAVAAGLEQVLIKKNYEKLVITRPIEPVGKDIGFLPGPQPLDAKIATPEGWTTMGELKIGSEIFSETGVPTKVIGIYPKGVKDVYRIKTSDGKTTECCEDHLWLTQTKSEFKHSKSGSVKTTRQIMDTLLVNGKENHYLPMNGVVQYKEQKIEIDPYTMGTILGDGSIVDNVLLVSKDEEIIENSSIGFNTTKTNVNGMSICNFVTKPYNNKAGRKVKITNVSTDKFKIFDSVGIAHKEVGNGIHKATFQTRCTNKTVVDGIKYEFLEKTSKWQNNLKQKFCDYNLLGKKSFDKFIPDAYKYNTVDVRIGIIRGLMDTDGTVKKTGEASFCTTSKQLAEDIIEIVRSLGGRASISSRDRVGKQSKFKNRTITSKRISYEFVISLPETLNPFLLKRKAERYSKKYIHSPRIVSIEPIGKKEVQCILVENESHLYLTDDFIVTHNTMQEKMAPWVAPIRDNLDYIFSNKVGKKDTKDLKDQKSSRQPRRDGDPEPFSKNPHTAMMVENGTIEIEAVTYIRGRSIPRAFLIIDEAQNLSLHQLKTIITRAGEGTKIVLTGDLTQIDVHTLDELSSGLTHGVEKFKESFISGHITLKKGERSALATLAADLL